MTITLINCKAKWASKGIYVTAEGWHEALNGAITGYLSPIEGWSYDFDADELTLNVSGTITVPASIIDFGDGKAVSLDGQ